MTRIGIAALSALLVSSCMRIGDWGKIDYADFKKSEPAQGERRLEARIQLGVGELRIEPGTPSQTYELDLRYNQAAFKPQLDFSRQGDLAILEFELEGRGSTRRSGKNVLDLRLNPETQLSLKASTGVGESEIDLSGMKVESLDIEAGVGKTVLSMLSANPVQCRRVSLQTGVGAFEATGLGNLNFEELTFEGGVGGTELDFSGEWPQTGDVSIAVGVGGVEVYLPREIGFEIRASKSFLAGMSIKGFRKEGSLYRSENYEEAQKHVRLRIDAGIGGIDIRWK